MKDVQPSPVRVGEAHPEEKISKPRLEAEMNFNYVGMGEAGWGDISAPERKSLFVSPQAKRRLQK